MEKKLGFTLIELSIVLVIIGLIVGGVLVGRDLIKASERRKLVSEIETLRTSINTFYGSYGCLPGDCTNATTFFGTTAPNGATITNGNGDGLLDKFPTTPYLEVWQFPLQLSMSKLLPGRYSGTNGNGSNRRSVPGDNVPASLAYPKAGFTYLNWGSFTDGNDFTPAVYPNLVGNALLIGTPDSNVFETYAPFITPADALAIDQKIDDGKPASGRLLASPPVIFPNCATSNNSTIAAYNIAYGSVACGFLYNMQ